MMQVSALQARQKSKDIGVEGLRRQILDYQVNISCYNFDKNMLNLIYASAFHFLFTFDYINYRFYFLCTLNALKMINSDVYLLCW